MAQETVENNKSKEIEENERLEASKLLPAIEVANEQEVTVKRLSITSQSFLNKSSCLYYGTVVVTLIVCKQGGLKPSPSGEDFSMMWHERISKR